MNYSIPPAPDAPPDPAAVDRILALYVRASRDALKAGSPAMRGVNWYVVEGDAMRALARRLGLPSPTVAAVASALSPQVRWETVTDRLPDVLECLQAEIPELPGPWMSQVRAKARRAYHEGPAVFHPRKAPKTCRFTLNLLGHDDVVTVDRWAFRIAGLPMGGWRRYATAEASYIEAARVLGLAPSILQARTWTAARDLSVPISPTP